MKGTDIFYIPIVLSGLTLLFTGCPQEVGVDGNTDGKGGGSPPYVSLDHTAADFNSAFGRAAFLTIKAAADSLELAKDAGVDFDAIGTAVRAANRGFLFADLGPYMTGRMGSAARGVIDETVDLEEGLSLIAAGYEADIAALAPSPDTAVQAGLLYVEDGDIVISDDQRIPLASLDGIATVEVMNRVAAGESAETVIAEIQVDIERMLIEGASITRGLYIVPENAAGIGGTVSGARWVNGLVRYHFESGSHALNSADKAVARWAMNEWASKTGRVRFEEISPSLWDAICRGIGQTKYVSIGIHNLPSGVAGRSAIGSSGAFSSVQISPGSRTNERTWQHELGHALGLLHEHQRYDRDYYVSVNSSDIVNYGKIPAQTVFAGLYPVRIKIWFISITVYLPYVWFSDYGKTVGGFDFNSIMLYSNEHVSRKQPVNGSYVLPYNTRLSAMDIATVRRMY